MPSLHVIITFSVVAIFMALSPGPNMIYLVSRSLADGRTAGFISLAGVALGFIVYMLSASFGLIAILFSKPLAYDVLRVAGAVYLLYIAWKAIRPGGSSPFEVQSLSSQSSRKLFWMGFFTNLLNPKIAILYLSLLPQFINPSGTSVLDQMLFLGTIQIIIGTLINGVIMCGAGSIASILAVNPVYLSVQRWMMALVLICLGLHLLLSFFS